MLKPLAVNAEQFSAAPSQPDETIVNNVFKVLHGCYGSLFLSKFASGVLDAKNRDMGVASARTVWAYGLRAFSETTVVEALERCKKAHPEFPPSLPQFQSLCEACVPRKAWQFDNAIGMSDTLRSQYARQARAIVAKHEGRAGQRKTEVQAQAGSLDLLKQAIADAVGAAGGDEAAELLRLDQMFARRYA